MRGWDLEQIEDDRGLRRSTKDGKKKVELARSKRCTSSLHSTLNFRDLEPWVLEGRRTRLHCTELSWLPKTQTLSLSKVPFKAALLSSSKQTHIRSGSTFMQYKIKESILLPLLLDLFSNQHRHSFFKPTPTSFVDRSRQDERRTWPCQNHSGSNASSLYCALLLLEA